MGIAAYNRGTRAISEQISQESRARQNISTEHTEKALADIGTAGTARVIRRITRRKHLPWSIAKLREALAEWSKQK